MSVTRKTGVAPKMDPSVSEMFKVLLEDRKKQEEKEAEERRYREEELREQHRRHDEATAKREEEVHRQMELLQGIVEGIKKQADTAATKAERDKKM